MSVVHLLVNPNAGARRRADVDAISGAIRVRGHKVAELRPTSIDTIAKTIIAARSNGLERLVIAGGDGLIHHALPAIAGTGLPVGIVPIGTGNDFARAAGLTTDVDRAVDAALSAPTSVDLISSTSGGWAASVVTGGFSGRVNATANTLRFPAGQQRYTVATFMELRHLEAFQLRLEIDDDVHELTSTMFAIGNTRFFGGGMAICPHAVPSDGLLDVTVIGATSRRELARVLPTVFVGGHITHPKVSVFRGRRIGVYADVQLWADGEPFAGNSFMAAPGALRLAGSLVGA